MFTDFKQYLSARMPLTHLARYRIRYLTAVIYLLLTALFAACGTPPEATDLTAEDPVPIDPVEATEEHDEPITRGLHTATRLLDGQVLVAGGRSLPVATNRPAVSDRLLAGASLATAELYDPLTKAWQATGSLNEDRLGHTATLLLDGKVLITGGSDGDGSPLASAELYDPATGLWSATGSMGEVRDRHSASLLPDGRVLVAGGFDGSSSLASAELYDPAAGEWTPAGDLITPRDGHEATVLLDERVLVSGGALDGDPLAAVEIYDPSTDDWEPTEELLSPRMRHTATLLLDGRVLVAGGNDGAGELQNVELFDPLGEEWTPAADMSDVREDHTATLLADGQVLVLGGRPAWDEACSTCENGALYRAVELYNPLQETWQIESKLAVVDHAATLLEDGQVLITGGGEDAPDWNGRALLFTRTSGSWEVVEEAVVQTRAGTVGLDSLSTARSLHSATLLPGGSVLVAGGVGSGDYLKSVELFDPAARSWSDTGSLEAVRSSHSATLLQNGLVLVAGGNDGIVSMDGAELYDPATGLWTLTGSLNVGRDGHEATLLQDGRVLVSGGYGDTGYLDSAELYDPDTGLWTLVGSMGDVRYFHRATLLQDGRVLATGGYGFDGLDTVTLDSAELYDPDTEMWSPTGSLDTGRHSHSATPLENGLVLVAGGGNTDLALVLDSAELYDPDTEMWSLADSMAEARFIHTATPLPNGKVLVVGGADDCCVLGMAELYDAEIDQWSVTGSLIGPDRMAHTATLLSDFRVMVVGGQDIDAVLADVEIYNTDMRDYSLAVGDFAVQSPSRVRIYGRYNDFGPEINSMFADDIGYWGDLFKIMILLGPNFRALQEDALQNLGLIETSSAASTFITQEQMDALDAFFDTMEVKASPELQQAMEEEGDLLPPYDDFVGKSVLEARQILFDGLNTDLWPTTTSLTSTPNPSPSGEFVTFTATINQSQSNVPASGNVTFFDGSTVLAMVAVNASGQARYVTSTLADGQHNITARYNGATLLESSTSNGVNLWVGEGSAEFAIFMPVVVGWR